MLDLGWGELLIIGVVALIVVGPRDLPRMFRALGRYTGKMRGMARDFQRAMNQAADESGIRDVAKDIQNSTSESDLGLDALDKVAKRVTTTLSSSPGKIVTAGAGTAAANLIMNPAESDRADAAAREETLREDTKTAQAARVTDGDCAGLDSSGGDSGTEKSDQERRTS